MTCTYKIKSLIAIVEWHDLIRAVFPDWNGEPATFDGAGVITVTFESVQSPQNLGPLIKVELISE
jgi:hypothetical protein